MDCFAALAMTAGGAMTGKDMDCRAALAMTSSRHCEERSDVAIHPPSSLRGAQRRGNPPTIVIARSAATWQSRESGGMDCFAGRHCEERSDVAVAMTKVGRWILRANTGPVLS
jgi:hypothetical protein